ncbi:acyl-CoA thioesterase [Pseudoduganella violaceinigra]|uniref:acyl-CoA thioesterase n=1 Tax=Pseudoduganella violaceinigra TaxID=246602 RepID=UPI0003FDEBD6|nr:thioesterase family protein [Pseudoduganella violaceinigra]
MIGPSWDSPRPFILPVTPQAADIDGLDHTNNAVYVRWCEEAGWAHSNALGLTLADYKRLDRGMAIRRSEFDYIFATGQGEALLLGTWLLPGDSPLSMQRRFQLVRQSDSTTVLRARWDLVCIELSSGRPKRLPPEFSGIYLPAFAAL